MSMNLTGLHTTSIENHNNAHQNYKNAELKNVLHFSFQCLTNRDICDILYL